MFEWAGKYVAENIIDNTGMFGPLDSEDEGSNNPKIHAATIVGHLGLPVGHADYTGIFKDCGGERLNGSRPYTATMQYKNNVSEFCSSTHYSAMTRNILADRQDLYNAYNTESGTDGNIQRTFSTEDPDDGTYWMPVNDGDPYYYVERFAGPKVGKIVTTQGFCRK